MRLHVLLYYGWETTSKLDTTHSKRTIILENVDHNFASIKGTFAT